MLFFMNWSEMNIWESNLFKNRYFWSFVFAFLVNGSGSFKHQKNRTKKLLLCAKRKVSARKTTCSPAFLEHPSPKQIGFVPIIVA